MRENAKMARKLGYLTIPDEMVVPIDQALKMKPKKVVLMSTGSQGEPASILGRLAAGRNRHFDIIEGDTVVLSSHPIPGNEETVYRTINKLFQRGANVIYDPISPVHVSGHASQEEIKLMLHLIKPKYLIPIHGELRHLRQHGMMAKELGIPAENIAVVENGTPIEFKDGKMRIGERIPGGHVFVDGSRVGDVGPAVLRERETLSRDGFVMVNLLIDKDVRLQDAPEVITKGFVYKYETDELIEDIDQVVDKVLGEHQDSSGLDELQSALERSLRSALHEKTRRKPLLFVMVNQI
jgi:ribonuclease J